MKWQPLHFYSSDAKWTPGSAFRKFAVEYFASLIYILIGTGATFAVRYYEFKGADTIATDPFVYLIINALAWTFAAACAIGLAQNISGGHANFIFSFSSFFFGGLGFLELCYYTIAQFGGMITGSAILFGMIPANLMNSSIGLPNLLDATQVNSDFGQNIALGIEIMGCFILSMAYARIMHFYDPNFSGDSVSRNGPLFIAFTLGGLQLIAYPISGAAMNPTRAFAPAAISGVFGGINWIYWVGGIVGASGNVVINFLIEWQPRMYDMNAIYHACGRPWNGLMDGLKFRQASSGEYVFFKETDVSQTIAIKAGSDAVTTSIDAAAVSTGEPAMVVVEMEESSSPEGGRLSKTIKNGGKKYKVVGENPKSR